MCSIWRAEGGTANVLTNPNLLRLEETNGFWGFGDLGECEQGEREEKAKVDAAIAVVVVATRDRRNAILLQLLFL